MDTSEVLIKYSVVFECTCGCVGDVNMLHYLWWFCHILKIKVTVTSSLGFFIYGIIHKSMRKLLNVIKDII
jgi:hypothetical protein